MLSEIAYFAPKGKKNICHILNKIFSFACYNYAQCLLKGEAKCKK